MASYKIEFVPRLFRFEVAETPVYGGRLIDEWYGSIALRARAYVDEG